MDDLSARQESCFSGDPVVDLAVLVLNLVLVGYVLYAFHGKHAHNNACRVYLSLFKSDYF